MIIHSKLNFEIDRYFESKIGLATLTCSIPGQPLINTRPRSFFIEGAMFTMAREILLYINQNHPNIWNQL